MRTSGAAGRDWFMMAVPLAMLLLFVVWMAGGPRQSVRWLEGVLSQTLAWLAALVS